MTHLTIERPHARIAALERRAEWLARRIQNHGPEDKGRAFDQAELVAIELAIRAIRLHLAMLTPETNPLTALRRLVDAARTGDLSATRAAARDAEKILEQLGA